MPLYSSSDDHMLLGCSAPGGVYPDYNIIPGGGIEDGEDATGALKREMLEEVNLDISKAKIELVNDTGFGKSEKTLQGTGERVHVYMHFSDFYVLMPDRAQDISLRGGDDFAQPEWIPISKLPSLKLTGPTKVTLKKLGYL